MPTTDIGCPCCGDPMDREQVVCWTCYRLTNRLTPGTHKDDYGTFKITRDDVLRWDRQRNLRV